MVIQLNSTRQTESNEPVFLESGFATNNGGCGARPYLTASLFSNAFILDATIPPPPPNVARLVASGGAVGIAILAFRDPSFSWSRVPNSVELVTTLVGSCLAPQEFVEESVPSRCTISIPPIFSSASVLVVCRLEIDFP